MDAIPKLREPVYPEVEERDYLNKREKAELVLSQGGRCAGCGIKPKAWEYDHRKARWKGDTDQSDLATWQAFGSRDECGCHAEKTAEEAGERAYMLRCRGVKGQRARRERRGGSSIKAPAVSALSKTARGYVKRKIGNRGWGK